MSLDQNLENRVREITDALDTSIFEAYQASSNLNGSLIREEVFRFLTRIIQTSDTESTDPKKLFDLFTRHIQSPDTRERLYDGVSKARADRDQTWEHELDDLFAQSTGVGAVHLELGVWSAWPEARKQELKNLYGLSEVVRLDIDPSYELDVVGDAQRLPFRNESIDQIQADSVLEHLPNPHQVIRECFRVLRPGGFLHITTPFVLNVHGYPDDYLRYTPSFYEHIFQESGFRQFRVDTDAARGLYCTLHNSSKTAIVDEEHANFLALQAVHLAVMTLLGSLVPFDNFFENKSAHWFHAVRCFAVKTGKYQPTYRVSDE